MSDDEARRNEWLNTAERTLLAFLRRAASGENEEDEWREDREEMRMMAVNGLASHRPDWLRAQLTDAHWPLEARRWLASMLASDWQVEASALVEASARGDDPNRTDGEAR
jgi:hypothetical protein